MKQIPLTQGKEALVSDCDYKYLMQWKWFPCKSGSRKIVYAIRNPRKVNYVYESGTFRMHKIIAKRMGLRGRIDHKDGNGLNNQRSNFRQATNSQNLGNRGKQANNRTSKFKGVSWESDRLKWKAQLMCEGKKVLNRRFAGTRAGEKEAAIVYNKAAIEYFGEFAFQNPV